MILKFKPNDFEECLMGLPIENWLLVDQDVFEIDEFMEHGLSRPKMMISHLKELKGIEEYPYCFGIKGYTHFDAILNHPDLPLYFRTVLEKARNISVQKYHTLGCHLSSINFDRMIYPMLVASDANFILKSYMKEREIKFKEFTVSGKVQFSNYNEIIYELLIPKKDYENISFDVKEYSEIQGDSKFSYFMGCNQTDLTMAIMLPTKRVYKCETMEKLIIENNFVLDSNVQNELLKSYYTLIKNLRLQLKYKNVVNKIFDEIIWQPLKEMIEGRL